MKGNLRDALYFITLASQFIGNTEQMEKYRSRVNIMAIEGRHDASRTEGVCDHAHVVQRVNGEGDRVSDFHPGKVKITLVQKNNFGFVLRLSTFIPEFSGRKAPRKMVVHGLLIQRGTLTIALLPAGLKPMEPRKDTERHGKTRKKILVASR